MQKAISRTGTTLWLIEPFMLRYIGHRAATAKAFFINSLTSALEVLDLSSVPVIWLIILSCSISTHTTMVCSHDH